MDSSSPEVIDFISLPKIEVSLKGYMHIHTVHTYDLMSVKSPPDSLTLTAA